ncbi:unnamed protein product [Pleuronectes platessa]|uniref:Uncharacterized protein n=1 Tax=Pleuronectes platessa TaxID=8262 RepID=A0A9N7UK00_PLEPL|nr:unnamed protein product [Pleuronectes platessa]
MDEVRKHLHLPPPPPRFPLRQVPRLHLHILSSARGFSSADKKDEVRISSEKSPARPDFTSKPQHSSPVSLTLSVAVETLFLLMCFTVHEASGKHSFFHPRVYYFNNIPRKLDHELEGVCVTDGVEQLVTGGVAPERLTSQRLGGVTSVFSIQQIQLAGGNDGNQPLKGASQPLSQPGAEDSG